MYRARLSSFALRSLIVSLCFFAAVSCSHRKLYKAIATPAQEVTNTSGDNYIVDTIASRVTWIGTKPGGSHTGIFSISSGNLNIIGNRPAGGDFTINIASLQDLDLSGDSKATLEKHLKSADFFDVEHYPTASFKITNIAIADTTNSHSVSQDTSYVVSGNLTIKDVTKNVSFPARIVVTPTRIHATADFIIDRSDWQINYKGPNNPLNWIIRKEVTIKLDMTASKK